ncbi:stalk domain-containing protein [Paenibacillus turpanensis]|uniref:stalk domain-containing protein n=1 Tax=Paenibacillus turpanensis TaxID=2689078 RepID=UPI00140A6381|nr:stalk domain-containing protein [Paenibacillus turpanensis]
MKKRMILLFGLIVCLLVPTTVWAAASSQITALLAPHFKLVLNGRVLDTSTDTPIVYNDKSYVPLRLVSEALGYEVKWDGENSAIHFSVPEEDYPLIKNDAVQVHSMEPNYDLTSSLTKDSYLGGINLDIAYTITEDQERRPVIVMEVVNKDRTVLSSETELLNAKAGTYSGFIHADKFRLPYDVETEREEIIKMMTEDYYYRITVK